MRGVNRYNPVKRTITPSTMRKYPAQRAADRAIIDSLPIIAVGGTSAVPAVRSIRPPTIPTTAEYLCFKWFSRPQIYTEGRINDNPMTSRNPRAMDTTTSGVLASC